MKKHVTHFVDKDEAAGAVVEALCPGLNMLALFRNFVQGGDPYSREDSKEADRKVSHRADELYERWNQTRSSDERTFEVEFDVNGGRVRYTYEVE